MNLFSKNLSFHFFGVGLWFLIGWLTPSSEGLSCYVCKYYTPGGSALDKDCLDPVTNNVPPKTCPPTSTFCKKSTIITMLGGAPVEPYWIGIKTVRECGDGLSECKTTTKIIVPLPEINNGQPLYDVNVPELIRNWTLKMGDGFESTSTRTCTSDNCNMEPGKFTTTCNGSNFLVNQNITWANIISVVILISLPPFKQYFHL